MMPLAVNDFRRAHEDGMIKITITNGTIFGDSQLDYVKILWLYTRKKKKGSSER